MLGRIKFLWERLRSYCGLVQMVMVAYLFVKESGITWWWAVVGVPLLAVVLWIDSRWVVGEEMAIAWRKNPEWRERTAGRGCDHV